MFKLVRDFLPNNIYLGFDANNGYSVPTAIQQGRAFEDYGRIDHFEEPLPQYDLPGLRQVADALDVAVSTGEQDWDRWRFRDVIQLGNPDILQPDILGASGPSEILKIYTLATTHNKPIMPHSPKRRHQQHCIHPLLLIHQERQPTPRVLHRVRTSTRTNRRTLRRTRHTP